MTDYVVGFLMSNTSVLLIQKERPDWQKGKYNGIGGKIEPRETAGNAMVREFYEETNLIVNWWQHFATIESDDNVIYFYRAWTNFSMMRKAQSMTDERVFIYDLHNERDHLYYNCIPNLSWLIPLAMYTHDVYQPVMFTEENYD